MVDTVPAATGRSHGVRAAFRTDRDDRRFAGPWSRRTIDGEGTLTYTLANCPYRDAVRENQPVVCALHRGITRGLLDEISPRTRLTGFIPKDPDPAGRLIRLKGALADEAAEASRSMRAANDPSRAL